MSGSLALSLAMLLAGALQAAATPCTPAQRSSCATPPGVGPGGLRLRDVPQFITITFDDAVSPQSYGIVQQILGGLRQRNGCGVPATHFVTATDTVPAAVQALYLSGHEIATHTLTHPSYPSAAEIVGAREWLVKQTGIPRQRINGYRAPFLLHNAATRQTLAAAGFLYDSSMSDTAPSLISPSVKQRGWPYSMADGLPQACETGECSPQERYPGLWEIPLAAVADAQGQAIGSMDPSGDAFANYKRELGWRLAGNRAPLGLYLHAGLESQPERIAQLRAFIRYAAALKGVHFVTNQQLLAWMQRPVAASAVGPLLACPRPTDISPAVGPVCATFVADCVFGAWSSALCRCQCLGEGTPGGYARDRAGQCTVAT